MLKRCLKEYQVFLRADLLSEKTLQSKAKNAGMRFIRRTAGL